MLQIEHLDDKVMNYFFGFYQAKRGLRVRSKIPRKLDTFFTKIFISDFLFLPPHQLIEIVGVIDGIKLEPHLVLILFKLLDANEDGYLHRGELFKVFRTRQEIGSRIYEHYSSFANCILKVVYIRRHQSF